MIMIALTLMFFICSSFFRENFLPIITIRWTKFENFFFWLWKIYTIYPTFKTIVQYVILYVLILFWLTYLWKKKSNAPYIQLNFIFFLGFTLIFLINLVVVVIIIIVKKSWSPQCKILITATLINVLNTIWYVRNQARFNLKTIPWKSVVSMIIVSSSLSGNSTSKTSTISSETSQSSTFSFVIFINLEPR